MHCQPLRTEVSHYLILADQLKAAYGEIDDETLADTLEGISELPEMIQEVVRSSLDDESLIEALKSRMAGMSERLDRFKRRAEKKRALACWAMQNSGLHRVQAEDFSASLRPGSQRLEVVDETAIPPDFLIPQPPRVDRSRLLASLKDGQMVEGATLVSGDPHIAVRTK